MVESAHSSQTCHPDALHVFAARWGVYPYMAARDESEHLSRTFRGRVSSSDVSMTEVAASQPVSESVNAACAVLRGWLACSISCDLHVWTMVESAHSSQPCHPDALRVFAARLGVSI